VEEFYTVTWKSLFDSHTQWLQGTGTVIIFVLQIGKLRQREVSSLLKIRLLDRDKGQCQ
jgi:hypothetical protein